MTLELEGWVSLTATLTGSYEAAAQLIAKWGCPVDGETIRAHVRRVGQKAETQVQERLAGKTQPVPAVKQAGVKPTPFSLVVMMDGCLARHRGADWSDPATQPGLERVAWQEIKGR